MSVWFEGEIGLGCSVEEVRHAVEDHGEFFVEITRLMPGMYSVELIDQGTDHVTIKTNEGLMRRTNISKRIETGRIVMEFDEVYGGRANVTATSHYCQEFTASDTGVTHRLVMTDVEASGFLGFFYQKLGSSRIGKAVLEATKAYVERE